MKEQIEEMTFILSNCCDDVPNDVCENTPCNRCRAKRLYNAGYRKQSETAEEIFKDIYQILADADIRYEVVPEGGNPAIEYIFNAVAEQRKKYKK